MLYRRRCLRQHGVQDFLPVTEIGLLEAVESSGHIDPSADHVGTLRPETLPGPGATSLVRRRRSTAPLSLLLPTNPAPFVTVSASRLAA